MSETGELLATSITEAEFPALYERFAPYVHAILIAKLPPPEVEDVLQDVFCDAWRKIGQLEDPAAFPGWIASIARHKAVDYYRARKPTIPIEPHHRQVFRPPDPILEALRQLPEAYQETLALRFVQGLSGPEIAALTGLTHGSVRVNLSRGLKMLRDLLGVNA